MFSKRALVVTAGAALLLSRIGRARLAALPARAAGALRRDPYKLPKGVEEFPATFVDKRQTTDADAPAPMPAEDAAGVTAEYYQEHPAG